MSKGKYAARAANRLANLDNELLREKVNQLADRDREITRLKGQLSRGRSQVDAEIVNRADELASRQIAAIRVVLDSERELHAEFRMALAEALSGYFRESGTWPYFYLQKLLPRIIPDEKQRSQHLDWMLTEPGEENPDSRREWRRHGAENLARSLRRRDGSDNPLARRGYDTAMNRLPDEQG